MLYFCATNIPCIFKIKHAGIEIGGDIHRVISRFPRMASNLMSKLRHQKEVWLSWAGCSIFLVPEPIKVSPHWYSETKNFNLTSHLGKSWSRSDKKIQMLCVLPAIVDLILSVWIIIPFAPCYGLCSGSIKNLRWKSGLVP